MPAMIPMGMLMRKAQRQENSSASQPPSSGPSAAAPPNTAPHSPKATARSLPTNRTLITAMDDGSIIEAPTACTRQDQDARIAGRSAEHTAGNEDDDAEHEQQSATVLVGHQADGDQ